MHLPADHGRGDLQLLAGDKPRHVEAVSAEVQQRTASGERLVRHPGGVPLDIAAHRRTDPAEENVRNLAELARLDHALHGDCPEGIAGDERAPDPGARGGGETGEAGNGLRVGPPRLFHDERHTGVDKKPKDLRHVAMPAQRDDEFRLRRLDHLPVVGERGAAKLFGALPGDPRRAVGDPDDVAPEIPRMRRYEASLTECQWLTSVTATRFGMVTAVLPLRPSSAFSCQKITRRDNLDADPAQLRQDEFVAGHQRRVPRGAQRREFSIIGVSDHGEGGWIDRPGKLVLGAKEVGDLLPIEARDPPQDRLGLVAGRLVPDQPEPPFADVSRIRVQELLELKTAATNPLVSITTHSTNPPQVQFY